MTAIRKIELIRIKAPKWDTPKWWCTSPMDALYNQAESNRDMPMGLFNSAPGQRRDDILYLIVRCVLEDGTYGLGAIGLGSEAIAKTIEGLLAPIVEGESPFDTERLWASMYNANVNIARKGSVLIAMSGVDIAIWDALGKHLSQPVYNLLGGRTRDSIKAYCSAGYPMEDIEEMADLARNQVHAGGYTAFKMRFGYGPSHGRPGMARNVEMVKAIREALGDDIEIMADAYMGWNAPYAIDMIHRLEDFQLKWIEEPLLPDDYQGYSQVRRSVKTAIAGGEHEFTRWGFHDLLRAGAVDYVQPDVNRVGGITEARKIWALAQAHNKTVIPHAHNFHNQHLIMSHMNSPMSEHFPGGFRDADTFLSELFIGEAELKNGALYLSGRPGLGVELNEAIVDQYRI